MRKIVLAVLLAAVAGLARAQGGTGNSMNLSCIEALAAIEAGWLTGVFTFVPEKDSATAFADMLVHHKPAMRKFLDKLGRDVKAAKGLTTWDHDVVMAALAVYASPMASTLGKIDPAVREKLNKYSLAPTMSLAEMEAKRRAALP